MRGVIHLYVRNARMVCVRRFAHDDRPGAPLHGRLQEIVSVGRRAFYRDEDPGRGYRARIEGKRRNSDIRRTGKHPVRDIPKHFL